MKKLLSALFISTAFIGTGAQAQWVQNGQMQPNKPDAQTAMSFAASMINLGNYDEFIKQWQQNNGQVFRTVDTVKKGQTVTTAVIFTGCQPKGGMCNLTGHYRVTLPSGKSVDLPETPVWIKAANKPGVLQLGDNILQQKIVRSDEIGVYKVDAVLTDRNTGDQLVLNSAFKVVK